MRRAYAELVDEVRGLPVDGRRDLRLLIERSLVEERREEIADRRELDEGSPPVSTDLDTQRRDLLIGAQEIL